jgi:aminopeptidase
LYYNTFVQDIFLSRWARLLTDYCLEVSPGETILIQTNTLAAPLLRVLHNAILYCEAFPVFRLGYPGQLVDFHQYAKDIHLDTIPKAEIEQMRHVDAFLRIEAESNLRGLEHVNPQNLMRHRKAMAQLGAARAGKRWCITLFPTEGYALEAGMSVEQFERFVIGAMFLDLDEPWRGWLEIRTMQERLIERLKDAKTVRLEAPGTDLTLSVAGRTWRNSDGKRNMPSGEIFTSPIENSANGVVKFTVPSSVSGFTVSGVELWFKEGKVIKASAATGDQYLQNALEIDEGARFLGEIGIGTNYGIAQPTKNILFDEKIGGTAHLAIGSSYSECGGLNKSALHWDLILDMRTQGRITVDGVVFQENGKFV